MPAHRKSTKLLELSNNYRGAQKQSRKNEPEVGPFPKKPPEDMSDEVQRAWCDLVSEIPPACLGSSDRFVVELASGLLAEWRRDPFAFNAAKLSQLRVVLGTLGLTPGNRSRLKAPEPEPVNEFDDI
jgi:hypothetical protein